MRKTMHCPGLFLLAALLGGLLLPNQAPAQTTPVKAKIHLNGPDINGVTPKGEAEYRIRVNGRTTLKVEVESVNLPDDTILNVNLNNVPFTTLTLRGGEGEVKLDSRLGDFVPAVQDGDTLSVAMVGGSDVVAGRFYLTRADLKTKLTGPIYNGRRPTGKARYRTGNGEAIFEIEVEHINLSNGSTVTVHLNGVPIAALILTGGQAELEWESETGAVIPTMKKGDVLTVVDANNVEILSGTF